jgi:chromosome segregation protein
MPLRLKSLELQGYKTFASRTLFEFSGGMTAIVGPNGSGKSNIADSLRWVLGEQSYGLLRGKKTEDMIFNGSEGRPRAGMASATILFDNTDGWLPVDFSEVALTRRAYRDGRNEYLLNGQQVRLREINELLAQSGLAERTYTIIGQGMVDASLALKADDRRRLFEEAAGIGLYRSRREDALRRLETTKRNLERVLDILAELEPRLRTLERQARRAQEFARAQADLRLLLRDWYGYHWHRVQRDLSDGREALHTQEARLREARVSYQAQQGEFSSFRERLQELRARLSAWHRESSSLHGERETTSRELAVLEERRRALVENISSVLGEQERLQEEEKLARERQAEAESEAGRIQAEHDEARAQTETARKALESRQSERAAVEAKLQAARQQSARMSARRAELQARMDGLDARLVEMETRLEAAAGAIAEAEKIARAAEEEHRSARSDRERADDSVKKAQEGLDTQRKLASTLEEQRRARVEARSSAQAEQGRLRAQLDVLEQAEQSFAGYADGARFLLEAARGQKLGGARGALSSALDVPVEYEAAIAAALGDYTDAILIESGQNAEQALVLLEQDGAGRAALLPLEWLDGAGSVSPKADPAVVGVAASLVQAPADLRPAVDLLLGQVYIVKDRAAARRLVKGQAAGVRAVTLRGELFRADGSVIAGGTSRSASLSRPRQRREVSASLADATSRLEGLEAEVEHLSGQLSEALQELSRREEAVRRARSLQSEAQDIEKEAALEAESKRRTANWHVSQRDQLQAEILQSETERQKALAARDEAQKAQTEADESLRGLTGQLAGLSLEEAQGQVTYWSTRAAVSERALSDARTRLQERRQAAAQLASRLSFLLQRNTDAERGLADLDAQKEQLRQRESWLHEQINALQVQIEPAEKELEEAERQDVERQERESNSQRTLATVERQYTQMQMDVSRRQEALDNMRQKIQDDFGLVMFEYAEDVSGPVPLPFDGMVEQLPVITELPPELEEQVTQQRAQLRRMGPVNPEAKNEFDAENERYSFMQTQVADLQQAESDLREVIAELDELTRRDFSRTFEEVAAEFKQIFTRLFGGGSARLVLTDPENLIETGIDIEARLPGRREQGLALLSGGERSLTAIALVFALLKVSPTPVCVLDEVDAMLDEANVGRFRDLLAELSQRTQFVVVTHNRNTVQAADVIYGVTMGRDSASQVISLRLDEISDEMLKGSAD